MNIDCGKMNNYAKLNKAKYNYKIYLKIITDIFQAHLAL